MKPYVGETHRTTSYFICYDSLNRKYKDYVYRKMLVQEYLKK